MTNKINYTDIERRPKQCHLWNKKVLEEKEDIWFVFEPIQTFFEDSHFSRRLVKCRECGQLYLKEFYEKIDWVDGDDPQYLTFIPVRSKEEAEKINRADLWEIQNFLPKLNVDCPKGGPVQIYWRGR